MRATALAAAAIIALASHAGAETIKIDVGPNGQFAFQPNNIKAKVGDVLSFNFHPLNHSVVMGDFANPCAPAKTGGFFSGFVPVSSGVGSQTFDVTVNNTDPIFFYCAQNKFSHCISGMSGVVNEPSSGETLENYQSAAKSVKSASNPDTVFGGRFVANAAATSSPTTTSAAAASTTSCTTSNKAPNGNGYKRDTCSGAGSVQASIGVVAASLGMALLLS
ncbi:Cupredoxin [Trichoderma gracile]